MSALGTLTSLLVGKNDADLTPITLTDGQVLTWTHGVGTKQGSGGRAPAIRVWSWNPTAPGATTGQNLALDTGLGLVVSQPPTAPGIYDRVVITNTTAAPTPLTFRFLVEVVWEWPTKELDLIIGNRDLAAPGVLDSPYASPSQPAGTFGRFVFS